MKKTIKILIFLLAITPIIVDKHVFSPFMAGKSFFVWSIMILISLIFIIIFFYDKDFKKEILDKIKIYYKHPISVLIFLFTLVVIVSSIFAVDKYIAFWGDIERGEGVIGMIYMLGVFIFSLLIFEKKDWLIFFKFSLFISFIVLLKEFSQFINDINRPDSFFGNPAFLAGYLIFTIFYSLILLKEKSGKFFKYFLIFIFVFSIIGIFVSQTRGSILGILFGLIFILIYGIIRGKSVIYKKTNLRKISTVALASVFIFLSFFIFTKDNSIWQNIPGISRIVTINNNDSTVQTRFNMWNISLRAINPELNGWKKFTIGWGQDNFNQAYLKYFNPKQFNYEINFFDRAHNKILDILVMNGILGLIVYLSIFFFLIFNILKNKEFSWFNMSLLFVIISYFVHLMFLFDQVTTYIPLLIILSYFIYLDNKNFILLSKNKISGPIFIPGFFLLLSVLIVYIFFTNVLLGYIQMRKFKSILRDNNTVDVLSRIDKVFYPFTTAQPEIRKSFLSLTQNNYKIGDNSSNKLVSAAFEKGEEYLGRESLDYKFMLFLSVTYSNLGKKAKNIEYLKRGEYYLKKLISISPQRPDYNYSFALNLFFQKNLSESFEYFEKSFDLASILFSQKRDDKIEEIYIYFFKYFYGLRDKENLIKVSNRLIKNNYSKSDDLIKIIDYVEKNNSLPKINFE